MAGFYNDNVIRYTKQGRITAVKGEWRPLVASNSTDGDSNGETPLKGRRYLTFDIQTDVGNTLAIYFVNRNADGTFTQPTDMSLAAISTVERGNSARTIPLGDTVQPYVLLENRGGASADSARVVVVESR